MVNFFNLQIYWYLPYFFGNEKCERHIFLVELSDCLLERHIYIYIGHISHTEHKKEGKIEVGQTY